MRNSSLVEYSRADNVTGLKLVTEAADWQSFLEAASGRGAFRVPTKVYRQGVLEVAEVRMQA